MAVGVSSLSQVCRAVGQLVSEGVNQPTASRINVVIGTPAAVAPAEADSSHRLNLFFFRFEPSGFFPDNLPGEPWLLRVHCLVTPFCVDEDSVAAGENDLRVVGEVLRLFHEQPTAAVSVGTGDAAETYLLQFVFLTLGLDQLNQLWATQGDTVYRPSLLYEVSLAPVLPDVAAIDPPRVASLGFETRGTMDARYDAPTPAMQTFVPVTGPTQPATVVESWPPALCIVDAGACVQALSLQVGSPELAAFHPRAWVAGEAGATASLRWETWEAATGWVEGDAGAAFTIADVRIDPAVAAGATTQPLALPFTDRAGQFTLYAERTYTRAADGVHVTVRSNPVLINLFAA